MYKTIEAFIVIVGLVALIDVFAFMLWAISNQSPVDGFYVGAITKNIISLVI